MLLSKNLLADVYMTAKEAIIQAGFSHEIDWQAEVDFDKINECDFLREAAWVILSSGFRESVLRTKFRSISEAFLNWKSAKDIVKHQNLCRAEALSCFGHTGKIDAILQIAARIAKSGFHSFKNQIKQFGVSQLQKLPYIGPITCFHLGKNLGLNVVKPDRHLVRAAKSARARSVQELCEAIQQVVGDPIAVIDLVIWRYATINPRFFIQFAGTEI